MPRRHKVSSRNDTDIVLPVHDLNCPAAVESALQPRVSNGITLDLMALNAFDRDRIQSVAIICIELKGVGIGMLGPLWIEPPSRRFRIQTVEMSWQGIPD